MPRLIVFFLCIFLCSCAHISKTECARGFASDNLYTLDESGRITLFAPERFVPAPPKDELSTRLCEDGTFEFFEVKTDNVLRKSKCGERICLCAADNENFYLLCNDKSEFARIEKYSVKTKSYSVVAQFSSDAERVIFSDKNGKKEIQCIYFADGARYVSDKFSAAEAKIRNAAISRNKIHNIYWIEKAETADIWLAEVAYTDRPPIYVSFDFTKNSVAEIVDDFKNWETPTSRVKHNFTASDGENIDVVLTYPQNCRLQNLPTIVFPHGGPAACNTLVFDYRADILASEGFLVVQPNYRGSSGYGKTFRFGGFGARGITRAQLDISESLNYVLKNGWADKNNVFILGGSWGGFCAAYALTTSKIYKAGVLLFGAYDIPQMLKSSPKKSGANKGLDKLQYGNSPEELKQLEQISPFFNVKNVSADVLLYHFFNDDVIEFEQSKRFYNELKKNNKKAEFICGKGVHGFPSMRDEYNAYKKIVKFFGGKVEKHKPFD